MTEVSKKGTWFVFKDGDFRHFGDSEGGGAAAAQYAVEGKGGGLIARIPPNVNGSEYGPARMSGGPQATETQ